MQRGPLPAPSDELTAALRVGLGCQPPSPSLLLHWSSAVFISRDFSDVQVATWFTQSLPLRVVVKSGIYAQPEVAFEVTCLFLRVATSLQPALAIVFHQSNSVRF